MARTLRAAPVSERQSVPQGSLRIPTRNHCIYCGSRNVRLTDEHVVPYSLGGRHVLEQASCDICADVTKRFEQDVARDLWGDARAAYNAPTRRKKERATEVVLKDPDGLQSDLTVLINDYPAVFVFYEMPRAGILDGRAGNEDLSSAWILSALSDDKRREEFHGRSPRRLTAKFRNVPMSFGRLIAKIGYCQVLTSLSPADFDPVCLPYILGESHNLSHIVGARPDHEPPEPNVGYRLVSHRFGTDSFQVITATVRLLANCDTPTYHVVVGLVRGQERVREVSHRLEAQFAVNMPAAFDEPRIPPSELHWMPRVWPIHT